MIKGLYGRHDREVVGREMLMLESELLVRTLAKPNFSEVALWASAFLCHLVRCPRLRRIALFKGEGGMSDDQDKTDGLSGSGVMSMNKSVVLAHRLVTPRGRLPGVIRLSARSGLSDRPIYRFVRSLSAHHSHFCNHHSKHNQNLIPCHTLYQLLRSAEYPRSSSGAEQTKKRLGCTIRAVRNKVYSNHNRHHS